MSVMLKSIGPKCRASPFVTISVTKFDKED